MVDADCTYLNCLLLMTKVRLLKMLPCTMISSTVQFVLRKKGFAEKVFFMLFHLEIFRAMNTSNASSLTPRPGKNMAGSNRLKKEGAGSVVVMGAGARAGS